AQRRGLDAAGINAVRSGGLTPAHSHTERVKKKKNLTLGFRFVFSNSYSPSPTFTLSVFYNPCLFKKKNPPPQTNTVYKKLVAR
ncbi:hypothetical protein ACVGV4_00615, partial [Enterobacter hormaechei]